MSRALVQVRPLDASEPSDVHDLTALWLSARAEARGERSPLAAQAADHLAEETATRVVTRALTSEGVVGFVVRHEGAPAGYLVLTVSRLLPLVETASVNIEHLYVVPALRRRGLARVLLSAAASYAEHVGADQVATSAPAGARESNRFFARLGFTPFVLRRVCSVPTLRRRLSSAEGTSRRVEDVLLRRRSLRATRHTVRARSAEV